MTSFSEVCPEEKPSESPKKQESKRRTLVDRSQEFTDKLDEMIKQLTAMETSMEEENKR